MDIKLHSSTNTLSVSDAVFGADYNEGLIHQVLTAYMAAGRAGTAKQKTKGEVSGGGKKPWKQKGTGQARAGSIRSPLWRGGGVTHAAQPRDYTQKVNKKMYRGAIRAIVSELNRTGNLIVAEQFTLSAPKTKGLLEQLGKVGTSDILIVTSEADKNLSLSARNLHTVAVCGVEAINPLSLLQHEKVLMTKDAVKKLEAWLQ